MQALIIETTAPIGRLPMLGLSLRTRAAFAAADAGAHTIEIEPGAEDWLAALQRDERLTLEVRPRIEQAGARLVLRADALVSPLLLAALECDEAIVDASGERCAAHVWLDAGADAAAAMARARPRAFSADRYRYALRVVTQGELGAARQLLLQSLIKPSDGPVSRHLNRPISLLFTRASVALGVKPNHMTALVALAGLLAAACATQPSHTAQLLGAGLFQLHSILDGCDGEIARKHGALLDSLVDDASNLLFFMGLSYGVARAALAPWPLYAGALTGVCYAAVAYIQYAVVLRTTGKGEKTAFWQQTVARKAWWLRALHALGRRDVFVLAILLAVAANLAALVVAILPCMAVGALAQSTQRARALRHGAPPA
jgi:phosphatidylglycerophosphate synthase